MGFLEIHTPSHNAKIQAIGNLGSLQNRIIQQRLELFFFIRENGTFNSAEVESTQILVLIIASSNQHITKSSKPSLRQSQCFHRGGLGSWRLRL